MYIVKAEPISEEFLDGLKYTATHEAHNGYVFEYIIKVSVDEGDGPTDLNGDYTFIKLSYNNEEVDYEDHNIDIHAIGAELTRGILQSVIDQLELIIQENSTNN